MKRLFLSEWKRQWSKVTTWLCVIALPVMLYATTSFCMKINRKVPSGLKKPINAGNFSVYAIIEKLLDSVNLSGFNAVIIMFVVLCITEEYLTGQLRMVMIRSYTVSKIFIAKVLVILSTIFVLLLSYFLASVVVGTAIFPKAKEVYMPGITKALTLNGAAIYTLKYYSLIFLILSAFAAFMIFIAVVSKSVTGAIGAGLGFILCSMFYPIVINVLALNHSFDKFKAQMLSIITIENQGVIMMLGDNNKLLSWNVGIIAVYFLVSMLSAYMIFSKRDSYI